MTSSIKSFTEFALYNRYVLNVLCPSNCELKEIEQKGNSVLDAIKNARTDVFNNPIKTSRLHTALKPVRFVARMVYTVAVTALISPLGAAFNGTRMFCYLTKWTFCKLSGWELAKLEAKAKTKEIAYYFFLDLGSFAYGLGLCSITSVFVVGTFAATTAASEAVWLPIMGAGLLTYLTEAYAPDSFLPRFLSNNEDRAGMYISLALRNRLGICGKGGSLLKFGVDDAIVKQYTGRDWAGNEQFTFVGAGTTKLVELIVRAELKLLDDVREAKAFLAEHNETLHAAFWPLNGNVVANKIEEIIKDKFPEGQPAQSNSMGSYDETVAKMRELMNRLRTQQNKITLLFEIRKKAFEISVQASPQLTFLMMLARTSPPTFTIREEKTFVEESFYKSWFNIPFSSSGGANSSPNAPSPSDEFTFARLGVTLEGLDPKTTLKNDEENLAVRFKRKVQENVWKLKNHQSTDSVYSLIDLKDDFSENECKVAYRKYALRLHPDKNKDADAKQLFQILENINASMQRELEKRK